MSLAVLILAGPAALGGWAADAAETAATETNAASGTLRRPVAVLADAKRVWVGNQTSGTLSVIDAATLKVVDEWKVGRSLTAIARFPGTERILVTDGAAAELLALDAEGDGTPQRLARLPADPVRLVVSPRQRLVCVSCRWSRQLVVLEVDAAARQVLATRQLELPFPPQEMVVLEREGLLLVADAFGGRLALLDLQFKQPPRYRELPAHNIRGLALQNSETVLMSHQTLDSRGWADRDGVHWGILMANSLHGVPLAALRTEAAPGAEAGTEPEPGRVFAASWLEPLGVAGQGSGDPGPVAIDAAGRWAVALSGIGEVAISGSSYKQRLPVGTRPLALAIAGDRLWVANQLDDSVTAIDLRVGRVLATVPLGTRPKLTAVQRGERLFYDARLAHDGWMSCHSCHCEGHTNGLLADTQGDGGFGAPKRIPSLLGTAGTGPWAWNGSSPTLAAQVQKSVETTMQGRPLAAHQAQDLAAYLEHLAVPPPREEAAAAVRADGKRLFRELGCVECHRPPNFTSAATYDVGLVDAAGNREFNPPSLRGVGHRQRLFHDGRYRRLEDVFGDAQHQLKAPLSPAQTTALLAFLRSL